MKYYIIAGEASGDLHGANLIKQLVKQDPQAEIRAWGGDRMEAAGAELVKHYRELAFMGFIEVIANLRTILRNIKFCKKDIAEFQPDAVILIDYPGFNLRIAPFAQSLNTKVFYYISPQIWAWKQSRVKIIQKYVDRMFVILPFEKEFYERFGVDVDFVGHPLLDALEDDQLVKQTREEFLANNNLGEEKIVALLPGSRRQEINSMLPTMLAASKKFPDYQYVIAGAPSIEEEFYRELTRGKPVEYVTGQTYTLLRYSHAALVTSGTATLETGLLGIPEVVCYKGSWVSYQIARRLVKVDYISLVNLIMEREVITELIQDDMNEKRLAQEMEKILENESVRSRMTGDFDKLREILGGAGASEVTASLMLKNLKS